MIIDLINAWKAGNELRDPEKWKIGAILANAVGALLLGIIQLVKIKFPDFEVSPEMLDYVTKAVCYVLAAVNIYIHKASTKKI